MVAKSRKVEQFVKVRKPKKFDDDEGWHGDVASSLKTITKALGKPRVNNGGGPIWDWRDKRGGLYCLWVSVDDERGSDYDTVHFHVRASYLAMRRWVRWLLRQLPKGTIAQLDEGIEFTPDEIPLWGAVAMMKLEPVEA